MSREYCGIIKHNNVEFEVVRDTNTNSVHIVRPNGKSSPVEIHSGSTPALTKEEALTIAMQMLKEAFRD